MSRSIFLFYKRCLILFDRVFGEFHDFWSFTKIHFFKFRRRTLALWLFSKVFLRANIFFTAMFDIDFSKNVPSHRLFLVVKTLDTFCLPPRPSPVVCTLTDLFMAQTISGWPRSVFFMALSLSLRASPSSAHSSNHQFWFASGHLLHTRSPQNVPFFCQIGLKLSRQWNSWNNHS